LPIFCFFPLFLRTFTLFCVKGPKHEPNSLQVIFMSVLCSIRTDGAVLSPYAFLSRELLKTGYRGETRCLGGS
jgi:hypothetical protein